MVAQRLEIPGPGLQKAAFGFDVIGFADRSAEPSHDMGRGVQGGDLRRIPPLERQVEEAASASPPSWPWRWPCPAGSIRRCGALRAAPGRAGGRRSAARAPRRRAPIAGRFAARASPSMTSPREELMTVAPGFIFRKRAASAMWRVEASSGVWKVSRSASRGHLPERQEAAVFALLARRVARQHAEAPRLGILPHERSDMAPTTPSVLSAGFQPCVRERWTSTAPIHCSTPRALQPAAVATWMPRAAHQARSIWSNPMVAVAMSRTREPSSSVASHRVRVRMIRGVGVADVGRRNRLAGEVPYRHKVPEPLPRKGMALSAMIFHAVFGRFGPGKYSE